MSRKIIGVTVGTPLSPAKIEEKIKPVKTVNGVSPDASGNVEVQVGVSDDDIRGAFETALQQAKDSGEFDGEDGVSPTVSVTPITGGNRVSITDANGTKRFDVMNGKDGAAGAGSGDMLASMYDPQGMRLDIFAYVDEKTKDIDVDVTADEVTFADGETFQQKYDNGELKGADGSKGSDGKTPVKGTDYFTEADKQEIVAAVLASFTDVSEVGM